MRGSLISVSLSTTMPSKFRTPGYHPLRKIKVALAGLHVAVLTDFSVAYKVALSLPVLIVAFFFRQWVDLSIILLATGLMLIAELFNSSIEVLCDFVEQREDEKIRIIKDIAAAAAGISIVVWATILVLESLHIWGIAKP